MKKIIINFFIFILLILLVLVPARKSLKQVLPRTGEVEIIGNVYTPYLLFNSGIYFLKSWDESVDLLLAIDYGDKARLKLTFANKRLLELERLTREKDFTASTILTNNFDALIEEAIAYARKADKQRENNEELVWLFQESVQDQQKIFNKIMKESPEDKVSKIMSVRQKSKERIERFIIESHKVDEYGSSTTF